MRLKLILLLLALGAAPAGAQLLELQPGARVRITAPGLLGGRVEGMVIQHRGNTLTLAPPGVVPIDVPIAAITSASIYRGKSRSAGALWGMLWGGAISVPLALLSAADEEPNIPADCDPNFERCEESSDVVMVAYTIVGGVMAGAGIGALIGKARWEVLEVPTRPVVSWAPRRGVRFGVALGF